MPFRVGRLDLCGAGQGRRGRSGTSTSWAGSGQGWRGTRISAGDQVLLPILRNLCRSRSTSCF